MSFLDSSHCRSRIHCGSCRTDPAWRSRVGAPEECPHGLTRETLPLRGLGDVVEKLAHPVARAIHWPCLDRETDTLKPNSPCAKIRNALNKSMPFKRGNPPGIP